jgi:hypothetical protein
LPSIIKTSEEQLARFLNLTTLESKQLNTLVLIFKEIENKNIFPVGKDFNWWIRTCDEALTNSIKNNKYIK